MAQRSRRNIIRSGNALNSQRESQRQKSQENLDKYDMPDINATIHVLGEAQKEIVASVKQLKNSIPKLSEKANDKDCMPGKRLPNRSQLLLLAELAGKFCKKYFQHEERVMMTQLNNTRQKHRKDLVTFVKHFRDLALDCYDKRDEEALVEICISNIVVDYRVYLENIGISQFTRLLEVVRKTNYFTDMEADTVKPQVLQENPKFKSLFDQLEYGPEARNVAAEALMHRAFLNNNNAIIFTDNDMEVAFLDHKRALEETIGYIEIDLKSCLVRSFTNSYVIDINVAYHALLGRPWINKHRLVAFNYHQSVKKRIGLWPIGILGNKMPFNLDEVHYSYVEFYNDFSRIILPHWEEVRDLNDQEFLPEANVPAYTLPQCSKVALPDGCVAHHL
ncbi:hypothetical protein D8674_000251 [Pyrus ussuriensis x Pyrus communis]|uniref:Uncharacterized protein n=1 Tax=Pyrus ussuriensis x Pyrus communis TaxID=2448454 RepID=A0A5N5F5G5_9ROSA|nr:hypothetical protein D8674_000251 [Pyrus ussuriensis x Pyrus communis]